jgi:hypothetical protein
MVHKFIGPFQKSLRGAMNTKFEKKVIHFDVRVALATEGQMLGYEDVINFRNYTTSVKCISKTGVLYKLNREVFNNMMMKDDRTWQLLCKMAKQSDDQVMEKIKKASKNIIKH